MDTHYRDPIQEDYNHSRVHGICQIDYKTRNTVEVHSLRSEL